MNVDDYLRLTELAIAAALLVWAAALAWRKRARRDWRPFFYNWPVEFTGSATRYGRVAVVVGLWIAAIVFTLWCGAGAAFLGNGM